MDTERESKPRAAVTRAPAILSEQDAWEIAMAWQPQLQNKVRLVMDRDGPVDSIIKSYAWVRISEPRSVPARGGGANHSADDRGEETTRREAVSVLRAVMLSWGALAASPGYSGAENAMFWKRVISTLQEDPEPPQTRRMPWVPAQRPQLTITDARGFFDQPGHVFPRFMVDMPNTLDDSFAKLFSPRGPTLPPAVHEKLQSILARLRSPCHPRIDVCLSMHAKYPFMAEHSAAISALLETTTSEPTPFQICLLDIYGSLQFAAPEHIDGFLALARALPLPMRHFFFSPLLNGLAREHCANWLYAFLRIDGHGVQAAVTSFTFQRFHASTAVFQALMSALPFATSVHSLAFDTQGREQDGSFESTDLPWIAYAIFHPRATSSSWKHLDLTRLSLTAHSTHVLTAMAKGNNLLALLNGTSPDSEAYYSAQLPAGTVVRLKPLNALVSRMPGVKNETVYVVPPERSVTVDVCGLTSLKRTTWGAWVEVIVPAYGLGRVRARELQNVQAHAPAGHSLSGLHLRSEVRTGPGARDDPPETVLHFLRPLGHMITYLDMRAYRCTEASTLWEVLSACPSLKTLVASHAGTFWSDDNDDLVPQETQLEELELSVDYNHLCVATPSQQCLSGPLCNLGALRFRVWDMTIDQLDASRAALAQLLRHAHGLRYLHWRNNGADFRSSRRGDREVPYTESVEWTPRGLTQLELTDPTYVYAHKSLSAACAVPFLSVVTLKAKQEEEKTGAIGRITDRGVLMTIFEFAASPVQRVIFIEPNNKDAETHGTT